MHILDDFHQRGLIQDIVKEAALRALMSQQPIKVYCGVDPTGDSLHIGHLFPFLTLKRLQNAGHKPIVLVGGFTASCGDPSFKSAERQKLPLETLSQWSDKLTQQLTKLLSFEGDNAAQLVNNKSWFDNMPVQFFLRDIGRHFSVNNMVKKASVVSRLNNDNQGMSFTEFSYSLLQGYDFAHLYNTEHCQLQIGGSDQFGNIVSGIELTRRLHGADVFGFTQPLMTKADGQKFGKTETGTIWLDGEKTSPYAFYQFWLNTSDDDVEKLLKAYTFLPLSDIADVMAKHQSAPEQRLAQALLAKEVTCLIHGNAAFNSAKRISELLFKGEVSALTIEDFTQLSRADIKTVVVNQSQYSLSDVLLQGELVKSKSQARQLISSNAIKVNGLTRQTPLLTQADALHGKYALISKGKKAFCLAEIN